MVYRERMRYHISSFRRLCSSTSLGRVVKSASSAVTCENIFSTLFQVALDSYMQVCQKEDYKKGSWADFVSCRDVIKNGFETTKPTCWTLFNICWLRVLCNICQLSCDIDESGGSPGHCVLSICLQN